MKYKVGDIVKLRDDLEVNKFYGKTKLNEAMVNVIGKKAEIKEICESKNKDEYFAKFASRYGGNWFISDEMIEGLWEECNSVNSSVKKYKLIDILNKIANGELKEGTKVVRKEVEGWGNLEYTYINGDLEREGWNETIYLYEEMYGRHLNEEVELIEPNDFPDVGEMAEPTDNTKIEKLVVDETDINCLGIHSKTILLNIIDRLNKVINKVNIHSTVLLAQEKDIKEIQEELDY